MPCLVHGVYLHLHLQACQVPELILYGGARGAAAGSAVPVHARLPELCTEAVSCAMSLQCW